MEFSCEKKELQNGVSTVEKIVATKSTLPIISNILFEINKNEIRLSANNLEIGMQLSIGAKVDKEGSFLLPAKMLSGIVSRLPDGEVKFKVGENGKVRITYGGSHFNLHSLPADEFPSLAKVKEGKSVGVDPKELLSMIKQTIFSVSNNEEKFVLTGLLFEFGKAPSAGETSTIRVVATDGYRLAKRGGKLTSGEATQNVIVPARALQELSKILESEEGKEVKINFSNEQISFKFGDAFLVSRIIQGQFPDYKQVIPKKNSVKVILNTKEFLKACERAGVIASGSANVTSFELKENKLHIIANTPDVGSIEEIIGAETKGTGKVKVSFNVRLIIDALTVIDSEKVVVEMSEGLNPGVIKPDGENDYLYIIMPIRTQEVI
ncbi:MAG: DNA polymerase III subunit beta [Candidatus Margulisiibacteriota bacterium]